MLAVFAVSHISPASLLVGVANMLAVAIVLPASGSADLTSTRDAVLLLRLYCAHR